MKTPIFSEQKLIDSGFTFLGYADGNYDWNQLCLETDTKVESTHMFHTEYGWSVFVRPGHSKGNGYISHPILP